MRGRIINPVPWLGITFFGKGEHCFVLVHLKNGNVLGGLYTGESFASSYPEPQEIFLSEVWRVDENGRFQNKIEETKGVLVNHEVIEYLEFYTTEGASSEEPRGRPTPRGDSLLLQRGYTPKASLSPDKIVPPKGGTGETTLATRPPFPDNPSFTASQEGLRRHPSVVASLHHPRKGQTPLSGSAPAIYEQGTPQDDMTWDRSYPQST